MLENKESILHWISVIADVMTVLGLSGVFSWSYFKKDRTEFQKTVIDVSFFSIKSGLLILALVIIYSVGVRIYVFQVTCYKGFTIPGEILWDSKHPIIHLLAYLTTIFFMLPIAGVASLLIYRWSTKPVVELLAKLVRKKKHK